MGPGDVYLLCYFGGKFIDDDKNAKYIGGSKKGGMIQNNIGFASFKEKIQEIIKIPSNGVEFKIKCGVHFGEATFVGLDVDDDQSLQFVIDNSKVIMAYILEHLPTTTTDTTILREEDGFPSRDATPTTYTATTQRKGRVKNPIDGTSSYNPVEMKSIGAKPPDNDGMSANGDILPTEIELECFLDKLRSLITNYGNPSTDGNCGFRALCMALGRSECEWAWMRAELVKEIESNKVFYHQLFGVEQTCELIEITQHSKGLAPSANWMLMPHTGFVFVQAFNVVLAYYSEKNICTFVPFLSPPNADNVKILGIGLVKKHYIKLDFQNGCPLPPLPHIPSNWRTICPGIADSWGKLLAHRLTAFMMMNVQVEPKFDNCLGNVIIIDREDPVLPSAAIQLQAKDFIDGSCNNSPVEVVNEHGDVNHTDISGADINHLEDRHHRSYQSNTDHQDEGTNLLVSNQESSEGNDLDVLENLFLEGSQTASKMERMVSPLRVVIDLSDTCFAIGREFPNMNALKSAISDEAVRTRREYKCTRTDKKLLIRNCRDLRCSWYLEARLSKLNKFEVVKYQGEHTCSVRTNIEDNCQAKNEWILSKMKSRIEKNPEMEPTKIVEEIKNQFGIKISYSKAVKVKTKVIEVMRNCHDPLPWLVKKLEQNGSAAKVGSQYFFWAFGACINALRNYLRPVVYVGRVDTEIGVLLYARGIDGDSFHGNHIEVGFGFYDFNEDEKLMWETYLGWLKEFVLPLTTAAAAGIRFSIITNVEETGLTHAVENVLPHLNHIFRPEFFGFATLCDKARDSFFSDKCEAAVQEMWSLNKEVYILKMVERSRVMVAKDFSERRVKGKEAATMATSGLAPGVIRDIQRARYDLVDLEVQSIDDGPKYQVSGGVLCSAREIEVVDMEEKSCTCGKFQATK